MSVKITIYDNAIPMLDEIAKWSYHSALASLDQAGMEIRDRTREAFATSAKHKWFTKIVNGKRVHYKGENYAVLGKRLNFKRQGPDNMSNMIDSFLMEKSMTLVVTGMHKSFTPRYFSKEAKQGTTSPIYGKKVGAVLGGSWQILKKFSEGGRLSAQDEKYRNIKKPLSKGADPFYKPRHFVQRGRTAAMGKVTDIMTTKLESLIHRQVNRSTVKTQIRAS